jgi:hypothetical protein
VSCPAAAQSRCGLGAHGRAERAAARRLQAAPARRPAWLGEGRRRSLRELVGDRRAARAARRAGPPAGADLQEWARNQRHGRLPAADPAVERRLGEALYGAAAQREHEVEGAAMGWEDPGRPREPEPPAQGWRDWWLRDEER